MKSMFLRAVSAFAALAMLVGLHQVAQPEVKAATVSSPSGLGVYVGSGMPDRVVEYERWLGGPVPWVLDFIAGGDWAAIDNPSWWLGRWKGTGRRVVYSAPMLPSKDFSLEAGAQGAYNAHWRSFAQTFVAQGASNAVIRIGWEFNGRFYPWAAGGKEDAYAAYWRQIVSTMRSVSGADFSFDWTPLMGATAADVERAYPGDAYVDVIGLDAYDQSAARPDLTPAELWQNMLDRTYGLRWHRAFAQAHGKPISFPEWGLSVSPTATVTNEDNPHYIKSMREWIGSSRLAYAMYFEADARDWHHKLSNGRFPKSAQPYRDLFASGLPTGSASSGSTASPSPSPTTTTTTAPPSTTTTASSSPTTTVAPAPAQSFVGETLWPETAAPHGISRDPNAVEVGVKFRTDVAGSIRGVRFYKGATNGGTHVASLWTKSGTLLARVNFSSETASGWQEVMFPTPVQVVAGATYIASYHTTQGRYGEDMNYFRNSYQRGHLTALKSGYDGGNGVYAYSRTPTFPFKSSKSRNYWVDVVFTAG